MAHDDFLKTCKRLCLSTALLSALPMAQKHSHPVYLSVPKERNHTPERLPAHCQLRRKQLVFWIFVAQPGLDSWGHQASSFSRASGGVDAGLNTGLSTDLPRPTHNRDTGDVCAT